MDYCYYWEQTKEEKVGVKGEHNISTSPRQFRNQDLMMKTFEPKRPAAIGAV
jgi:hypothetical protein